MPVLEEKLSQLQLPQEMPCGLVRIQVGRDSSPQALLWGGEVSTCQVPSLAQDPVPSRAARRRTPAQKLRDELRRLLGESWSEELECDVPHAWQRHGDLILLSEDSFRAALWEKLGEGEWALPAQSLPAELPWPSLELPRWVCCRSGALGNGRFSAGCAAAGQARTGTAGWDADPQHHPAAGPGWLGGARGQRDQVGKSHGAGCGQCRDGAALTGPAISPRYAFDVTKCMFSPGNISEKLRVASLPCSGEVLVDLYAGTGDGGRLAGQARRGRSSDAGTDGIQADGSR